MDPIRYGCALFVLAASCGGCRMCQSHTDHLPPVLDGPYSHVQGRAGTLSASGMATRMSYEKEVDDELPDPVGLD